jgi:hypothetical protein
MKAPQPAGSNANEGAEQSAVAIASATVSFAWGKDGLLYQYAIEPSKLPMANGMFVAKLLQLAGGSVTHRSKASLAALPEGGLVDTELFVKAVLAAEFRGNEKPSKDDVAEGQKLLNSVTAGVFKSAEIVAEKIKGKYGWEVTPDLSGFSYHALYLRQAAEAKRQAELEERLKSGDV